MKNDKSGFVDMFLKYYEGAGSIADDYSIGNGFEIKQEDEFVDTENYEYLQKGINVSYEYRFLSGITGIQPSPDWYTAFYLHDTVKEIGQTFWEHFVLRTYPWDAGTDLGQLYEDSDEDMDPPDVMTRFEVSNDVNQVFTYQDEIQYIAEWECVLHVCTVDEPGCVKDNWPPQCDVLRFPLCATTCDPNASPTSASTTSALAVENTTTTTASTTATCTKCHNGQYHEGRWDRRGAGNRSGAGGRSRHGKPQDGCRRRRLARGRSRRRNWQRQGQPDSRTP